MRPRRSTEACRRISIICANSEQSVNDLDRAVRSSVLWDKYELLSRVPGVGRVLLSRCFRTCPSWAGLTAAKSLRWREWRRLIATAVPSGGQRKIQGGRNGCGGSCTRPRLLRYGAIPGARYIHSVDKPFLLKVILGSVGPANKFSGVARFADWEPVPASFGPTRAGRLAGAREAVRDALLSSFSMTNGIPASCLLTGSGRGSVKLFGGRDTT